MEKISMMSDLLIRLLLHAIPHYFEKNFSSKIYLLSIFLLYFYDIYKTTPCNARS